MASNLGQAPVVAERASALRPHRRSTTQVDRRQRFDYWRSCSSLVELQWPAPTDPPDFAAEETTWSLGRMALMTAQVAALRYRRSNAQVRRDGLDHWVISIATRGERRFRTASDDVVMRPGTAWLTSLAAPYAVARGESDWIHLFVPHDELAGAAGLPQPGRPLRLDGATGAILHDYLVCVAGRVAELGEGDVLRLANATREIVAAALPGTNPAGEPGGMRADAQRARLQRLVRENLHQVTLGPDRLARLSGISRSQLYRLFEASGGVAAYIQAERLRAARRALGCVSDTRSIAAIAESVGLCDPSSFGRMFRRTFGCTARDWREAAWRGVGTGDGSASMARASESESITDLLRGLEAGWAECP